MVDDPDLQVILNILTDGEGRVIYCQKSELLFKLLYRKIMSFFKKYVTFVNFVTFLLINYGISKFWYLLWDQEEAIF